MIVLLAAIGVFYLLGLYRYVSLETVAKHRDALAAFVSEHTALAVAAYILVYVAIVSLSFPVAAPLSIVGGFLLGWITGAIVTIIAATIGAIVVYSIVRTTIGEILLRKLGPAAQRLAKGFNEDAFSYLLFLRLVPAFPFFAVNAAAGLTGVPLRTFALATFIGIIPGTLAFTYLGTGLDSIIDAQKRRYYDCIAAHGKENCTFTLDAGTLVTTELLIAFAALGVMALIPVVIRRWRARRG